MSSTGGKKTLAPRLQVDWSQQRHEQTAARVWQALHRKQQRRRVAKTIALCTFPAAIALLVWVWAAPTKEAPGFTKTVSSLPLAHENTRVQLHEGTVAALLTPTTKLRMKRADTHDRLAVLDEGAALFDVTQALPGSTFTVEVQSVLVEVLSGRFTVEHRAQAAYVACERGTVRVRWPGGERVMPAGAMATFPPRDSTRLQASGVQKPELVKRAPAALPNRRATPAVAAAAAAPEPALAPDVDGLIERANVARRNGDPRAAIRLLDEAMAADASPGWAAAAALMKGRVLLNEIGDLEAACEAFAWLRTHVPQNPLAEDALALEALALRQRGLTQQAETLVKLYLQHYPTGAHAPRLRALSSPL